MIESNLALPPEGSIMTATRLGMLAGLSFAAMASISPLALIAGSHPAMAQTQGPAALAGTVSSREEGKMEGVVVSAKRPGSTIMVSVSTNAQGQYSFPKDRLAPGTYNITMRAAGYTLKPMTAMIQSSGATQLDLKLAKATADELPLQLTNSEWILSAPGTHDQKLALLRCLDCHGMQRPIFSKEDGPEMAFTLQRMTAHSANASPNFPFFHQNASEILSKPPSKAMEDLGAYIASINLSSGETWPYKLKTQARPKGKSTQAIVTTYDLPEFRGAPRHAARQSGQRLVLRFPAPCDLETGPQDRQGDALSGSDLEARLSDRRPHDHDG